MPSRSGCTTAPSRTTKRPATIVCHADTGPQRSQASIGSAIAPANRRAGQAPHRQVGDGARREHADLADSPEAGGAAERRASPAPCAPCRPARRRAAWRATSPGGPPATATRSRPTTSRRRRARRAPRRPAAIDDRRDARREDQVAARAVGDADTGCAEPRDLVLVGITQCATQVRSVHQPVRSRYSIGRQPNVARRELVVLGVLGEVGVQAHVEALGELGGAHHQLFGDAERAARRRARCATSRRPTDRGGGRPRPRTRPGSRRRRPRRRRAAGRRPSRSTTSSRGSGGTACPGRGLRRSRRSAGRRRLRVQVQMVGRRRAAR